MMERTDVSVNPGLARARCRPTHNQIDFGTTLARCEYQRTGQCLIRQGRSSWPRCAALAPASRQPNLLDFFQHAPMKLEGSHQQAPHARQAILAGRWLNTWSMSAVVSSSAVR